MKIEGEINSIDGLCVLKANDWDGLEFEVLEGEERFVQVGVPNFMLGELPKFKPGDRVRVTVEVVSEHE